MHTFVRGKKVRDELPRLNDLHPPGRNGKALDVASAILVSGGCAGESNNLYGIARRAWCDRGSVNATVPDFCIASDFCLFGHAVKCRGIFL
jgi:hypothetical protein